MMKKIKLNKDDAMANRLFPPRRVSTLCFGYDDDGKLLDNETFTT